MSSVDSAWARWPSRSLIALARRRLARAFGARLGGWAAVGMVLLTLGAGVALYDADEHADLPELVGSAVRGLLWLGVGPLALSIANRRGRRDRSDGIELLAKLRGHSPGQLGVARLVAAVWQSALRIGWPSVLSCLLLATFAWQSSVVLLAQAPGLVLFALLAGSCVGALAALCERLGGRHGWAWLVALVMLPWAVGEQLGRPEWSVPGALDQALVVLAEPPWMPGGAR